MLRTFAWREIGRTCVLSIIALRSASPEFWGEVQPPASLKGLDIPSRRAVFVPWKPSRRPAFGMETRLFVEEPMLSTGLHFASESTDRRRRCPLLGTAGRPRGRAGQGE